MEQAASQLQSLMQISITQYTEIVRLMESITQADDTTCIEELSELGSQILDKQQTATTVDEKILPLLQASSISLTAHKGMAERTGLIEQVLRLNKIIAPKLTNLKALVGSELQQIKQGRSAIKGYQYIETKQGKNVNNIL